jgi:two-component system, cell cycle sensor histidine kinase and response regulator CckA
VNNQSIKVLLIDDDEEDYVITRNMFDEIEGQSFQLEWEGSYAAAVETIKAGRHDIYLTDYRLGEHNGMDLVRLVVASGYKGLVIMLTGKGERRVDIEATMAGAADYLAKDSVTSVLLERSIRHALERKQAAEALQLSEERYRDIVENAHDFIYSHDLNGNYTSINNAGEQITGYTREETLTMNFVQTVAPDFVEIAQELIAGKLAGEKGSACDLEIVAKDGRHIALEINTKLVFRDGALIGVQGTARDVTERKALEEQLRQSQKMEAIGRLAGGIAHDFNNLLTAITGYSELSMNQLGDEDPLFDNLQEIKKAGDRAASLTRQLLAFSRKQVLQPKVLDLNLVVSDMEKMLTRLIGEHIELFTVLEPKLESIKVDPGQIEQIIMNLAVNARDAMPQGGRLTIETRNVLLDDEYARKHIAVTPGPFVMLAVSDSGSGIDSETQSRIFEPFFTTKEVGKGTGLGLSTVYGIVKQSGGNIWVHSEVGLGTTFTIYLPRTDENLQTYKRESRNERGLRGTETVLIAEDEEVVRKLACQVLRMQGYQLLEAADGNEALLISQTHLAPIDLLITDVIMPGMSGAELANRLTGLRPESKVLLMSGYTDSAIVHLEVLDGGANFIQKPFSPEALAIKVREVLDAKQGAHAEAGLN